MSQTDKQSRLAYFNEEEHLSICSEEEYNRKNYKAIHGSGNLCASIVTMKQKISLASWDISNESIVEEIIHDSNVNLK